MHMDYILGRTMETLHKMNLTVFMSLLDMCIFHQHSASGLLVSNRGLERKRTMD